MSKKKSNYADDYIELLRDQLEKINNEVWYEIVDIHKEYSEEIKTDVEDMKKNIIDFNK